MRKKILLLLCLCLCFSFLVIGCNRAAKRPDMPNADIQRNNQIEMTGAEKRILADQISNLIVNVNGVKQATVVISPSDQSAVSNRQGITDTQNTPNNPNVTVLNVPDQANPTDTTNPVPANPMTPGATNTNPMNPGANPTTPNNQNMATPYNEKLVALVGVTLDDTVGGNDQQVNDIKNRIRQEVMTRQPRVSDVLVTTDQSMTKKINDVAAGLIEGKAVQNYNNDAQQIQSQLQNSN